MHFGRCAVGRVRAIHASHDVQKMACVLVNVHTVGWVRSVYASCGMLKSGVQVKWVELEQFLKAVVC